MFIQVGSMLGLGAHFWRNIGYRSMIMWLDVAAVESFGRLSRVMREGIHECWDDLAMCVYNIIIALLL